MIAVIFAASLPACLAAADVPSGASPVAITRLFLKAIAAQDEAAIRQLCLPNHALSKLWTTPLSPADKLELDQTEKDDLRVLKAGEVIPIAGVNHPIPPAFATASNVLVYAKSVTNPYNLVKFNGEWRINAGPIVAAIEKQETQARLAAIKAAH
jgi:hypothetical protein